MKIIAWYVVDVVVIYMAAKTAGWPGVGLWVVANLTGFCQGYSRGIRL